MHISLVTRVRLPLSEGSQEQLYLAYVRLATKHHRLLAHYPQVEAHTAVAGRFRNVRI